MSRPREPMSRPPSRPMAGHRIGQVGTRKMIEGGRGTDVRVRTATDGRDMLVNDPDGWEVDQPWLWWDGPAGGDGTGGPIGNPPPGAGWPLSLPAAVTRCTSLIADTIAGLPWYVHRGQERLDTPDWIGDPQARRIDLRISDGPFPEWRKSTMAFRSSSIRSMLWQGEAMWYCPTRDAGGQPLPPLWQINPDDVGISNGRWAIGDGGDGTDPGGYTFQPGELIVVQGLPNPVDDLRGIGVMAQHWAELGLAADMQQFASNMLRAGVPNGYLKVNSPQLTRDKARELQGDWMRSHGGPRKKIAVLNATTDFHALSLDPAAMQLAQMRDYSILDIALMFGVPAYMLGIRTDANTYANITSRMIELAEFTLLHWTRRIESALDAEFTRGTELRINLDGLRRADTLTRYQAYKIALDTGFMTANEVRALENLPPLSEEQQMAEAQAAVAAQPQLRALGGGQ